MTSGRQSTANSRYLPTADRRLPTRRWQIPLLAVLLIFASCNSNDALSERPPQLLSQRQMVSFLIDLHLAEAKMNHIEAPNSDSTEIIFRNYERYLIKQHGFTDSVYLQSYAYYLDHMELMNEIYNDVVDSLSVMNSQQKVSVPEYTDGEE